MPNDADDDETWINVGGRHLPGRPSSPVSGGFDHDVPSLGEVYRSFAADPDDGTAASWVVTGVNWAEPDAEDTEGELTAIAECIDAPAARTAPNAERHAASARTQPAKLKAASRCAAKRR